MVPLSSDSLRRALAESKPDSVRIGLLLALSESVRDTNIQLALGYLNEASQRSQQLVWPQGIIRTAIALGSCYEVVTQHEKAIACYQVALVLARRHKTLGVLEVEALHHISESYYLLQKNDSMLYYRMATLQTARREQVAWAEFQSLNFLAGYSFDQKNYPLAISRWRELVRLMDARGYRKKATMILNNIAEAYTGLGSADSARAMLEYALHSYQQAPDERTHSYILYSFYRYYQQFGSPDSALLFAQKAYQSAQLAVGERTIALHALDAMSTLYARNGAPRKALEAYQAYIHLRDSVDDHQRKAAGRRTLMGYEFNQQINDTRLEGNRLRRENGQRRNALLVSLIGLLLFAGLAALLFLAWLRIRRQHTTIHAQSQLLRTRSQSLTQALDEKELLMKEIHHRVKNNLQMISALQHLQASRSKDPAVKAALEDSQNRVLSIAFIHQNLYQHNDLGNVDLQSLFEELTGHILDVYSHNGQTIHITRQVDPVLLDIDTAVPLGLMLNELLTNSCKHAFTGRTTGQIAIRLQEDNAEGYRLEYKDDGPGLPPEIVFENARTLGLRLISRLTEQLEGTLHYESEPVHCLTVTFKSFRARNKA